MENEVIEEEKLLTFSFNKNVDIDRLFSFICNELSFQKVKKLYDLLDYSINTNLLVEKLKENK